MKGHLGLIESNLGSLGSIGSIPVESSITSMFYLISSMIPMDEDE